MTYKATTGEKGTGYGLMLAKQWTESMNGNISITSVEQTSESNNNHGTSIRIFFSREKKEVAA